MPDEVFEASSKMWRLITDHIRSCRSPNCCVGKLVDNLDGEKNSIGPTSPQQCQTNHRSNSGGYGND